MVCIVHVAEQRNKVKAILFDTTSCAGLERRNVIVDPALVLGPVPFFAKAFNIVDVAGEDMSDLAQRQFAFAVAKRTEINQALSATEQLGQKIAADGHNSARC